MSACVVGVAIGTPYKGIGVTVVEAATGRVIEAVTVNPDPALGAESLADASRTALAIARQIVRDTDASNCGVLVVEDLERDRPRRQQRRAAAARADVQAAAQARIAMHGALLANIEVGVPLFVVPAIGEVPASECPDVLSGTKPAGWRGVRGSRREVQRTAWAVASQVRDSLVPVTADDYPAALASAIKACRPTEAGLLDACIRALDVVTPPVGAPVVPIDALERWALAQGLTNERRTTK